MSSWFDRDKVPGGEPVVPFRHDRVDQFVLQTLDFKPRPAQKLAKVCAVGEMHRADAGQLSASDIRSRPSVQSVAELRVAMFRRKPVDSDKFSSGTEPGEYHPERPVYCRSDVVCDRAAVHDQVELAVERDRLGKIANHYPVPDFWKLLVQRLNDARATLDAVVVGPK